MGALDLFKRKKTDIEKARDEPKFTLYQKPEEIIKLKQEAENALSSIKIELEQKSNEIKEFIINVEDINTFQLEELMKQLVINYDRLFEISQLQLNSYFAETMIKQLDLSKDETVFEINTKNIEGIDFNYAKLTFDNDFQPILKDLLTKEIEKFKNFSIREKEKSESDALLEKVSLNLANYYSSEQKMKEYLDFIAKLQNKYSYFNAELIHIQNDKALYTKSFTNWKNMDAKILPGQKALKILIPIEVTLLEEFDEENNPIWVKYADAKKETLAKYKEGNINSRQEVIGFKTTYVFDITQTDIPKEKYPKQHFKRFLFSNDPSSDRLDEIYNLIKTTINKEKIEILEQQELGDIMGISDLDSEDKIKVYLNERNSKAQNIQTLLHEYAHIKLKHNLKDLEYKENELQAELTTYIVEKQLGLDVKDFKLQHLQSVKLTTDLDEKNLLLTEVNKTSKAIYSEIEKNFLASSVQYREDEKPKIKLKQH